MVINLKNMKMKRILIPFAASALLLSGCQPPQPAESAGIHLEVTEIGTRTATVTVACTGPAPSLVRLTGAIPAEEFPTGETAQPDFIKTNGSAVTVPYSGALKDLIPAMDYVIGAISFDQNMDVLTWDTFSFRTEDLGTDTIGDPSGAGTLTENQLEDQPEEEEEQPEEDV